jgi:hypothetical protein
MAKKLRTSELDSVYLLKLVLYMIIGSLWLRIETSSGTQIPLPLGALIAILFAAHEHFRIDRKIEYAVILIAMFVGFWVPGGLVLSLN